MNARNQVNCPKCGWSQSAFTPAMAFGYNAPAFCCVNRRCREHFVVVLFASRAPLAFHLITVLHLPQPRPAVYDLLLRQVRDLTPEDRVALSAIYRLAHAVWTDRAAPAAAV